MVGAPNIGICFDVAHAVVSTGDWEAELKAALPHVRSVTRRTRPAMPMRICRWETAPSTGAE